MLIFQPPVNFCSDENIQTIFGTKLEDFSNYRIDYNSISQTVEKVVKKNPMASLKKNSLYIQVHVCEMRVLILISGRTRQFMKLFSIIFLRKNHYKLI
jgi:hypothetical protein